MLFSYKGPKDYRILILRYVDWGLYASEYIMLLSILSAFLLILFHKHRSGSGSSPPTMIKFQSLLSTRTASQPANKWVLFNFLSEKHNNFNRLSSRFLPNCHSFSSSVILTLSHSHSQSFLIAAILILISQSFSFFKSILFSEFLIFSHSQTFLF